MLSSACEAVQQTLLQSSVSIVTLDMGLGQAIYLEVEGLRIVLKKVKGQLVRQQDIILHGTSQAAQQQTTSLTERSIVASYSQRVPRF